MPMQYAIETTELTKGYKNKIAVDRLNLRVGEGEIFGFLGPNGAGKTTTILMLLGLTEPTFGSARVCGYDPTREPLKVKRMAGYLPEKVGFYDDMTARQNLEYTAALNGLSTGAAKKKIDELLELVGLVDVAEHKVGTFSHGMKQRLGIADVMIKDPKIAFFDEPTAGIDPEGTDQVLTLIRGMARRNVTVFISSHQLHQVQKVCTRVGIMANGRLVAEGSVDELGRKVIGGGKFRIEAQVSPVSDRLLTVVRGVRGVSNVDVEGDRLLISCDEDIRPQIARAIIDSESLLLQMKIEEYSLDDIYLRYFRD